MKKLFMLIGVLTLSEQGYATQATDQLLEQYRSQGAKTFSLEQGKYLFYKEFQNKETGQMRSCPTCHTENLTQSGKHVKTGKVIEPLAPSVHPKRLTHVKEINKWLKRNCEWTLGRECTVQEKGDLLVFIQSQ